MSGKIKLFCAASVLAAGLAMPGQAQLLLVTGEYRVTEVDPAKDQFGVALRDADPNVTQNWVHIDKETTLVVRDYQGDGTFKDITVQGEEAFKYLAPGKKLRVHGGRDWDNSIVAKKIWM